MEGIMAVCDLVCSLSDEVSCFGFCYKDDEDSPWGVRIECGNFSIFSIGSNRANCDSNGVICEGSGEFFLMMSSHNLRCSFVGGWKCDVSCDPSCWKCDVGCDLSCNSNGVVILVLATSCIPCKNSLARKLCKKFEEAFINSILKSKIDKIVCHLAKICFDAIFKISLCRTYFVDLQLIRKRNFWFGKFPWNLHINKTMVKISFLIVE